jgi:DNA-binding HxlR family transcriptional regulator
MDVPVTAVHDEACPLREVLDHVGGKWSVQILVAVTKGPIRFTALERSIEGISRRMLTLTLRNLERDGLLLRTVFPTVPAKVEYSATAMAEDLYVHLTGLTAWAEKHRADVATARRLYDMQIGAADDDAAAASAGGREPAGAPRARGGVRSSLWV